MLISVGAGVGIDVKVGAAETEGGMDCVGAGVVGDAVGEAEGGSVGSAVIGASVTGNIDVITASVSGITAIKDPTSDSAP